MGDKESLKVYLVIAYRYGNCKDYNFPIGVFTNEDIAKDMAQRHRKFRGFKYDHKMFCINSDKGYDAEEAKGFWITGNNNHHV